MTLSAKNLLHCLRIIFFQRIYPVAKETRYQTVVVEVWCMVLGSVMKVLLQEFGVTCLVTLVVLLIKYRVRLRHGKGFKLANESGGGATKHS